IDLALTDLAIYANLGWAEHPVPRNHHLGAGAAPVHDARKQWFQSCDPDFPSLLTPAAPCRELGTLEMKHPNSCSASLTSRELASQLTGQGCQLDSRLRLIFVGYLAALME